MYQANTLSVYTDKFPLKNKEGEMTAGSEGDPVTTTLTNSQAALLLMLYIYATHWIKSVPPYHSLTIDLEALANHPTKWDKQDLYWYNQIHFWSDVDIWKKKNKEVPSTVNTSTLTPVLSLPSPASTSDTNKIWTNGTRADVTIKNTLYSRMTPTSPTGRIGT